MKCNSQIVRLKLWKFIVFFHVNISNEQQYWIQKMEAIQCTENATEAVMLGESSRVLKRNIGELAVDGKINGEISRLLEYFTKIYFFDRTGHLIKT